jgi:hypothetical protein
MIMAKVHMEAVETEGIIDGGYPRPCKAFFPVSME